MSYYDEEFYYEPSEFDQKIDEFKEYLSESVKKEFQEEMDRLRKENADLQEIKANYKQIKDDYEAKKRELDFEKSNLKNQVRRERLNDLMKDFEVIMFRARTKSVRQPKCEKCDSNRRIKYTTPLGKTAYEDCTCSISDSVYYPEEYICKSFSINRDGNKLSAWYIVDDKDDYASYDFSTFAKVVYNDGMDYKGLNTYDTFFKTKEECQSFCDYLNAKR